jgi:hypothetical protein
MDFGSICCRFAKMIMFSEVAVALFSGGCVFEAGGV